MDNKLTLSFLAASVVSLTASLALLATAVSQDEGAGKVLKTRGEIALAFGKMHNSGVSKEAYAAMSDKEKSAEVLKRVPSTEQEAVRARINKGSLPYLYNDEELFSEVSQGVNGPAWRGEKYSSISVKLALCTMAFSALAGALCLKSIAFSKVGKTFWGEVQI